MKFEDLKQAHEAIVSVRDFQKKLEQDTGKTISFLEDAYNLYNEIIKAKDDYAILKKAFSGKYCITIETDDYEEVKLSGEVLQSSSAFILECQKSYLDDLKSQLDDIQFPSNDEMQ